jgi:hypothetical protein
MSAPESRSCGERAFRGRGGRAALLLVVLLLAPGVRAPAADDDPGPVAPIPAPSPSDQVTLAGDLPSSRTVWSFLETAEPMAAVDRIDGAGLHLGTPGRFSVRGASWTQNAFLLDGADLTDALRGGTPLFLPDVDAFEAVEIRSELAPVEDASPGVTMTLVPRAPAPSWRGTVRGDGLGAGLQARVPSASPPAIARFGWLADASAVASGPLAGERLRLLVSGHVARARRFERADPAALDARLVSGVGDLAYQPSDHDRLRLFVTAQAAERPFAARARFFGSPVPERARAFGSVLRWSRTGAGAAASAFAGFGTGAFEPETEGRDASRPVERLLEGPVPDLVSPAHSRRSTWTLGASFSPGASPLGGLSHAPRFGFVVRRAWTSERPGPETPIPETIDGLPARVWDYRWAGPDSHRHVLDLAGWGAERLTWGDRLLVEAGLRFERTTAAASGATQGVSWTALLPRVSARLRLTETGRLTLLGGWGEYRHRLLLDALAFGDPNAPQASVYRWTDANGDGRYEPDERGDLVARVGPGAADGALAAIDPGLRAPRTRELVAGLEASIGGGIVASFRAFDRRETNLVEPVNVGVPASGYTVRYLPDPGGDLVGPEDDQLLPVFDRRPETFGLDRYLLTNPADDTGLFQGVELRVEKAVGRRLALLVGATAYRTEIRGANRGFGVTENDQGVLGELYDDPNAYTYSKGRGYFDRAFTIKLAAAWRAPGDWRLGLDARYQDGQPFGRFVVVPDLAQGPELVPATSRGQSFGRAATTDPEGRPLVADGHRFSYTLTVDVRVEKGFALGPRRLALIVEAFNLLGTRNEVEEDVVWGPGFRDPTAVQPPRAVRLGARFDF